MITNEAIATQAAARAHQFWLEIEAEFTRQIARCQAGQPVPGRLPGDPRPRDDETPPGWPARPADPVDQNPQSMQADQPVELSSTGVDRSLGAIPAQLRCSAHFVEAA